MQQMQENKSPIHHSKQSIQSDEKEKPHFLTISEKIQLISDIKFTISQKYGIQLNLFPKKMKILSQFLNRQIINKQVTKENALQIIQTILNSCGQIQIYSHTHNKPIQQEPFFPLYQQQYQVKNQQRFHPGQQPQHQLIKQQFTKDNFPQQCHYYQSTTPDNARLQNFERDQRSVSNNQGAIYQQNQQEIYNNDDINNNNNNNSCNYNSSCQPTKQHSPVQQQTTPVESQQKRQFTTIQEEKETIYDNYLDAQIQQVKFKKIDRCQKIRMIDQLKVDQKEWELQQMCKQKQKYHQNCQPFSDNLQKDQSQEQKQVILPQIEQQIQTNGALQQIQEHGVITPRPNIAQRKNISFSEQKHYLVESGKRALKGNDSSFEIYELEPINKDSNKSCIIGNDDDNDNLDNDKLDNKIQNYSPAEKDMLINEIDKIKQQNQYFIDKFQAKQNQSKKELQKKQREYLEEQINEKIKKKEIDKKKNDESNLNYIKSDIKWNNDRVADIYRNLKFQERQLKFDYLKQIEQKRQKQLEFYSDKIEKELTQNTKADKFEKQQQLEQRQMKQQIENNVREFNLKLMQSKLVDKQNKVYKELVEQQKELKRCDQFDHIQPSKLNNNNNLKQSPVRVKTDI